MPVIQNKWVEKEKKKKAAETAPAFESNPGDSWLPVSAEHKVERSSTATRANYKLTLRGNRK